MVIDPYYGYDYGYDYGYGNALDSLGTMFLIMLGIYALVGIYAIAAYIMGSLGNYTIANRRGIKHPWLAWIPYGNLWILGSIADQYQFVSMGQVKNRRKVLVGLQIANTVVALAIFGMYIKLIVDILITAGGDIERVDPVSGGMIILVMLLLCLAVWVLSIILMVFRYISLYNLFASCNPNTKVAFILLSILLSFIEPFLVFACRNKDLGMPPRREAPVAVIQPPAPVDPPAFEE